MGVTSIPSEILDVILENEKLAISDVMNFALTCKKIYHDVTTSKTLWKTKTLQRWPFFEKVFQNAEPAEVIQTDWFDEMKGQIFRRQQLKKYLSQMSATNYGRLKISYSDMKELDALLVPDIGARSINYYLLREELSSICREDENNVSDDYFARVISPYITQTYVTNEWQKLLALPAKKQTIERGMVLIAQWMEPSKLIYAEDRSHLFDNVARLTRELIAEKHPDLLINRASLADEAEWKYEILDDTKWSAEDSKIIISALSQTMSTKIGLMDTLMIDKALFWKMNGPIILTIIFEAVARRLGLRFEIVEIGDEYDHYQLLRWKERCTPDGDGIVKSSYLDIIFAKSLLRDSSFEEFDKLPAATVFELVNRIADAKAGEIKSIVFSIDDIGYRWSNEFLHMTSPKNYRYIVNLMDLYILKGLNFGKLVDSFKNIRTGNQSLCPDDVEFYEEEYRTWEEFRKQHLLEPPKKRTRSVLYAVGMIVKYGGDLMAVITGWDTTWNGKAAWLTQDEVLPVRCGAKGPFYSICCDDQSSRLVPQEALKVAESPEAVNHSGLGRYLCKFMGRYYQPNVATARMYPEDVEFLNKLYEC